MTQHILQQRKWILLVCLFSLLGTTNTFVRAQDNRLVTVTIKYKLSEAKEVYLIWGVNNWQHIPQERQPLKTTIKNKVMYTLMDYVDDTFVTRVKVNRGDILDYGFLITKDKYGSDAHIWEDDGGTHFVTIARKDNKNNIIEVKGKLTIDHWMRFYFLIGISIVFGIDLLFPAIRKIIKPSPVITKR